MKGDLQEITLGVRLWASVDRDQSWMAGGWLCSASEMEIAGRGRKCSEGRVDGDRGRV